MFIGHFGIGFAAKAAAPRASLGTLMLAAQWLDLLWPTLLLLGVERVRIVPGETVVTPLVFEHYPLSHSLLAVLGWSLAAGIACFLGRRDRRTAIVIALLVASHWFLDAVVHEPDLPLWPGSTVLVGAGAWRSIPLTLAIELPLFALGAWLYARATRPLDKAGRWGWITLVALLLVIHAGNLLGPPPPDVESIAWVGQAQWLLVLWGYWLDRHRVAVAAAPQRTATLAAR